MSELEAILRRLVDSSSVAVTSGDLLAGKVESAIARDDERYREKQQEPPRRKPRLARLPQVKRTSVGAAPLSVLHALGRAISLDRQGSVRGLAEHWGCLKYALALDGSRKQDHMALSEEGRSTQRQHKTVQAHELGVGFGVVAAEHILRERYRDHRVSIVPAEVVLRAGWPLTGLRYRPRFFAEVWRPGERAKVFPVVCKGHHGRRSYSYPQLASASAHVEAVHIGPWNETPALVLSTELSMKGPIVVHVLAADGDGGILPAGEEELNSSPRDRSMPPQITKPAEGATPEEGLPGFHVLPQHTGWFRTVLAHTDAAGLTAFTGDGNATAPHLTKRQGREYYMRQSHAAISSVRSMEYTLLDIPCVGTEHVFRLNGERVEAFSGLAEDLFNALVEERLDKYRREVDAQYTRHPYARWDRTWEGAVSVRPDGSVLAIRRLKA
ncbi:hypothetical protein ACFPZ0_18630 [Streptomonospora nanhaiensis]|uniref:Uncharacterized protein n=1 Tax=Streptomonospora nanhaiensis TaxID=1323731 RepID=A0A853BIU5_9ACTN|nr:hypothetical protein [Streptomonospora nanhaiensis]MBV2364654.1 hypothetical protein [Streptomonospora nanhaiensis]MBX9390129.1 hypothetical protein [Streptomonospora nanhaiensis]NYI94655.1 hypothetical protein [Streptomonospora nanhaiensis]